MCLFYATCRKHTQVAEWLDCAKMTIDTKTIYNCAPVEQNQSDTIIILKVMHYHFKNDCCVFGFFFFPLVFGAVRFETLSGTTSKRADNVFSRQRNDRLIN